MTVAEPIKRYTPQEYYRLERQSPIRHEYFDGEIFAMSGGSAVHSLIAANITGELRQRLKGKPCTPYESNLRLKVKATGLRTYPDASVYCGSLEFDSEDDGIETATNPTVLFEVLSRTTEAHDRGFKADNYRQIETLKAYVLVSQISPHVELYERRADGNWLFGEARSLETKILITSIAVELPLAEIYDKVVFPSADSPFPRIEKS
jgi:Uma2 family endonuclease